jgi:hypothetical protein
MRDAPRFLALLFYLNTVIEGGETEFMNLNVVVPPKAGSVMVFPPFWMFPHAGRTPRSNDKYVLGTYLHYPEAPRNADPRERRSPSDITPSTAVSDSTASAHPARHPPAS